MSEAWHYNRSGKQSGPVSADELKQLASNGQLAPTDVVWKQGIPQWIPASNIKGLFPDAMPPEAGFDDRSLMHGRTFNMRVLGLIGTIVGGSLAALGGLVALVVFLTVSERDGPLPRGFFAALGLYFLGKGIGLAGLGVLGFLQASGTHAKKARNDP